MNFFSASLTVFIAMTVFSNTVHAQWLPVGGPGGGEIWALAANGADVIAWWNNQGLVNSRGVYLSTDNGGKWNKVDTDLPISWSAGSVVMNEHVIIAGGSNGLFRSIDKGKNWTEIGHDFFKDRQILSIAANDSGVFAGTWTEISYSSDNGSTWAPCSSGVPNSSNLHAGCIAVNGNTVFAGTNFGNFRSTDNGKHWSPIDPIQTNNSNFDALVVNGNTLFAKAYTGVVYRSTDNGSSWNSVNYGLNNCEFLATSGTTVFVISARNIYRSADNGASWDSIDCRFTKCAINALAANDTALFAGTRGNGVFRSTDNGNTWTEANSGLAYLSVPLLAARGDTILAESGDGVYRHTGKDTGWTLIDNSFHWTMGNNLSGKPFVVSGGNYIAGTTTTINEYDRFIFRGSLFLSKDKGVSWAAVLSEFSAQEIDLIATGNRILAVGALTHNNEQFQWSTVFLSTDTGATWKTLGTSGYPIISLAVMDSILFAGTYAADRYKISSLPYRGGVLVSTDGGATWSTSTSGVPDTINVNTLIAHRGYVFAGTSSGIYFSTDRGRTWQQDAVGLTADNTVLSFAVCDSTIFAGTQRNGIWRKTIPQSTRIRNDKLLSGKPRGYAFNLGSSARSRNLFIIDFTIPSSERVTITLYNLSGSVITTVIDKTLEQGAHRLLWNTHVIAKGCYMVRLKAGSAVFTRSIPVFR